MRSVAVAWLHHILFCSLHSHDVRYSVRDDEGRHCYVVAAAAVGPEFRYRQNFQFNRISNETTEDKLEHAAAAAVDISLCSQSANMKNRRLWCKTRAAHGLSCSRRSPCSTATREWNTISNPIGDCHAYAPELAATRFGSLMQLIYFSVKNW